MKKILLCTLAALSVTPITWAQQPRPEGCPSINAIQTVGFDSAGKDNDHYSVCQTSNYDTSNKWTFVIWRVNASSQYEAYSKAIAALATLSGSPEPEYLNGHFVCRYNIGDAYTAQPIVCKTSKKT